MNTLIKWWVTDSEKKRFVTKKQELGKTKNEVEGYSQAGRLTGCNKTQLKAEKERLKKTEEKHLQKKSFIVHMCKILKKNLGCKFP